MIGNDGVAAFENRVYFDFAYAIFNQSSNKSTNQIKQVKKQEGTNAFKRWWNSLSPITKVGLIFSVFSAGWALTHTNVYAGAAFDASMLAWGAVDLGRDIKRKEWKRAGLDAVFTLLQAKAFARTLKVALGTADAIKGVNKMIMRAGNESEKEFWMKVKDFVVKNMGNKGDIADELLKNRRTMKNVLYDRIAVRAMEEGKDLEGLSKAEFDNIKNSVVKEIEDILGLGEGKLNKLASELNPKEFKSYVNAEQLQGLKVTRIVEPKEVAKGVESSSQAKSIKEIKKNEAFLRKLKEGNIGWKGVLPFYRAVLKPSIQQGEELEGLFLSLYPFIPPSRVAFPEFLRPRRSPAVLSGSNQSNTSKNKGSNQSNTSDVGGGPIDIINMINKNETAKNIFNTLKTSRNHCASLAFAIAVKYVKNNKNMHKKQLRQNYNTILRNAYDKLKDSHDLQTTFQQLYNNPAQLLKQQQSKKEDKKMKLPA